GFALDFPDGPVRVSAEEADRLGRGQPLPDDHALSKAVRRAADSALVLYANPLMLKPGRWLADGDAFAFGVQKAYPGLRVYRDPLKDATDARAKGMNEKALAGPGDVVAGVADSSLKRADGGIML